MYSKDWVTAQSIMEKVFPWIVKANWTFIYHPGLGQFGIPKAKYVHEKIYTVLWIKKKNNGGKLFISYSHIFEDWVEMYYQIQPYKSSRC